MATTPNQKEVSFGKEINITNIKKNLKIKKQNGDQCKVEILLKEYSKILEVVKKQQLLVQDVVLFYEPNVKTLRKNSEK